MPAKQCEHKGCKEPAKYNHRNIRPAWCKDHKADDMVWTYRSKCECNKEPSFGLLDDLWATCCKTCATQEMTNIKDPKCVVCKKIQPSFGLPGESKYTHCKSCASPDMQNVKDPKCIKCKNTRPSYGLPEDSKPTHCKECSSSVMVDLIHPKCKCGKCIPSFGLPGDVRATRCKECKTPDMTNIVNNMCNVCKKVHPSFGMPGDTSATHCAACKTPDMKNITDRMCSVCQKVRPTFGLPGDTQPTQCFNCKTPEMVDVIHPKCASHHCDSYATTRYRAEDDGKRYCLHCLLCEHTVGDISQRMKRCIRKEIYVLAELERRLPWLPTVAERIQWDVGVDGSCTGKQPDLLLHFGNYVLIVEVDERQHGSYCVSGEKKRMQEIWEQLGYPPLGHIRFNHDAYTDSSGGKHKSIFTQYLVNGEPRLTSADNGEFEARMDALQAVVERMIERREEDVEFLCYSPENTYEADAADPELTAALAGLEVDA